MRGCRRLRAPFAPRFAVTPPACRNAASAGSRIRWRPLILTYAAIFLFQAANMGLLAYIIRTNVSVDWGSAVTGLRFHLAIRALLNDKMV